VVTFPLIQLDVSAYPSRAYTYPVPVRLGLLGLYLHAGSAITFNISVIHGRDTVNVPSKALWNLQHIRGNLLLIYPRDVS